MTASPRRSTKYGFLHKLEEYTMRRVQWSSSAQSLDCQARMRQNSGSWQQFEDIPSWYRFHRRHHPDLRRHHSKFQNSGHDFENEFEVQLKWSYIFKSVQPIPSMIWTAVTSLSASLPHNWTISGRSLLWKSNLFFKFPFSLNVSMMERADVIGL